LKLVVSYPVYTILFFKYSHKGGVKMYKTMLVPLDGSELAEVVLPYAKELAGRLDLELTLLHVCDSSGSDLQFMCRAYLERAAGTVQEQSREVQSRTGAPSGVKAVEVRVEVAAGHPAEEILSYAEENSIDLILMATHGRSGVRRWVLGSIADKVLRKSKIPIWLVRANIPEEIIHDEWPKRTMLVPLDGSKFAESVLPHVETLSKQRGAELVNVVLLRVYEKPFITADYPEPDSEAHEKRIINHFKQEAEQYLVRVEKHLVDAGLHVRKEVLMGKPADEIIKYAHNNHPNLVVMATHGSSGLSLWEYGDIANKILHGVSSPIFLVRPQ
jgi:nucleotide-binding universal stress UspA family protein